MSVATELAIGQVAEAAGVAVSAVRYYDELGLIEPARRVGGKRRFAPEVVAQVAFIRRAQATGLSLTDIKTLLDDQHRRWAGVVDRHLVELRQRRDELDVMISTLEEVRRCGCDVVAQCERVMSC